MTSSPLPSFFGHCTAKNKDIALKFNMLVVCMYIDHIYFGFSDDLKISDFIGNYFWKTEILNFGGQNRKISKIRDSHFVERSILRLLAFSIAPYFKTKHSSSLQTFAVFWPKMAKHEVTKKSFSQKILDGFF